MNQRWWHFLKGKFRARPLRDGLINFAPKEEEDRRFYSDFPGISEIDRFLKNGSILEARETAYDLLTEYPDSFICIGRMVKAYDAAGDSRRAEECLEEGIIKSKCKSTICSYISDRRFAHKDYPAAFLWWTRGCKLQIDSGILVEAKPFMNLSYIARFCDMPEEAAAFMKISNQIFSEFGSGPIELDRVGEMQRRIMAESLLRSDDRDDVYFAIRYLNDKSNKNNNRNEIDVSSLDTNGPCTKETEAISQAGKAAIQPLLKVLSNESNSLWYRKNAIICLGIISDERAVEPLKSIRRLSP